MPQIAIYGYDFKKAAKECWALVKDVGLMPLLNNLLVSAVGWMGARSPPRHASCLETMHD